MKKIIRWFNDRWMAVALFVVMLVSAFRRDPPDREGIDSRLREADVSAGAAARAEHEANLEGLRRRAVEGRQALDAQVEATRKDLASAESERASKIVAASTDPEVMASNLASTMGFTVHAGPKGRA